MDKTMVIYVGISSDPRTPERYYLDCRDTSRPTQDPKGRQMKLLGSDHPADLIAKITAEGIAQGVLVTFEDETDGL